MKKKFVQKELPSSWLSALLLHQVRDEWRKTGKADLRTLISVHEVIGVDLNHVYLSKHTNIWFLGTDVYY